MHPLDQEDANTVVTNSSNSPALTRIQNSSSTPKEKELFNPFTHQTIPVDDPKNEGATLEPPSPVALSETFD